MDKVEIIDGLNAIVSQLKELHSKNPRENILTQKELNKYTITCDKDGWSEKYQFTNLSTENEISIYCLDYFTGQCRIYYEGDTLIVENGCIYGIKK